MYYDKNLIYERLSGEEVAERLGLNVAYRDGRAECLCPARDHDDHNLGSCKITDKGCHCFACHRTFSLERMVEEARGIPHTRDGYMETLKILASFAGVAPEKPGTSHVRAALPFTEEQLKLIGLLAKNSRIDNVAGASDEKPMKKDSGGRLKPLKAPRDNDGNYLILGPSIRFSLSDLYKEDKEAFYEIVSGKVDEALERINQALSRSFAPELLDYLEGAGIAAMNLKQAFLEERKELLAMKQKCLLAG